VTVKNRHGNVIKGTVYQIALHECDDELINDEIKPAFEKLPNGLEEMEAQRQAWLPEGWLEAEAEACRAALAAIDNVFTAFKNASNPNDVTELPDYPYTITITNQDANTALDVFRKAVDALYEARDKVITSGRDPSIRLLEHVLDQYIKNYDVLGGFNTPRNNALLRKVFGYCQRPAPINLMQAFAQGPYYIVENKEKLKRTLEYRNWEGHFILPLDSDLAFRLGCEYFVAGGRHARRAARTGLLFAGLQNFLSVKNSSSSTVLRYAILEK
jgi:hypothetical protein